MTCVKTRFWEQLLVHCENCVTTFAANKKCGRETLFFHLCSILHFFIISGSAWPRLTITYANAIQPPLPLQKKKEKKTNSYAN